MSVTHARTGGTSRHLPHVRPVDGTDPGPNAGLCCLPDLHTLARLGKASRTRASLTSQSRKYPTVSPAKPPLHPATGPGPALGAEAAHPEEVTGVVRSV